MRCCAISQDHFSKAQLTGGDQDFEQWVTRLVGFVEALALGLDLPLDVRGTVFQQRVWQALREIPAGSTVTYTEIAERIGASKAARSPATRWGAERKRALLEREGAS